MSLKSNAQQILIQVLNDVQPCPVFVKHYVHRPYGFHSWSWYQPGAAVQTFHYSLSPSCFRARWCTSSVSLVETLQQLKDSFTFPRSQWHHKSGRVRRQRTTHGWRIPELHVEGWLWNTALGVGHPLNKSVIQFKLSSLTLALILSGLSWKEKGEKSSRSWPSSQSCWPSFDSPPLSFLSQPELKAQTHVCWGCFIFWDYSILSSCIYLTSNKTNANHIFFHILALKKSVQLKQSKYNNKSISVLLSVKFQQW